MKNFPPLLTACITTFNRPQLLIESLASLTTQLNHDFNILILDNSSDSETYQVVQRAIQDTSLTINYHRHEPMSISRQRNLALHLCESEYIGFLDDDDLWDCKKVKYFYDWFNRASTEERTKTGLWYSAAGYFSISNPLPVVQTVLSDPVQDFQNLILQRSGFTGSASNPIINIRHARKVGLYDERILTGEDWEFYLRLTSINRLVFEPSILTYIRNHNGPRLGGRLRDYVRTEIILSRQYSQLNPIYRQMYAVKISNKLIRLGKRITARKIICSACQLPTFSRQQLALIAVYVLSYLNAGTYNLALKLYLKYRHSCITNKLN